MDAAKEILNRNPLKTKPSIEINNPEGSNIDFYNITVDDFTIKDIDGIEKIKSDLELAI